MPKEPKTIIVTGTSGSGKTTAIHLLKERGGVAVYDTDEDGVPENVDEEWRKKRTGELLEIALKNQQEGKSTILGGVIVPEEVSVSDFYPKLEKLSYVFLHIPEEVIKERLTERGWNDELVQRNINWGRHLKEQVEKTQDPLLIDTSELTPKEVVDNIIESL